MNRRVLIETIGEDSVLAKLGVVTNLVFDRLLTLTDEAGLCPGEPAVIKGRCFAMMDDMTAELIASSITSLIDAELVHRGEYRGRMVLCFKPDSFQRIQSFRKDYRRKVSFGDLSQAVISQGLHGFVANVQRNRADSARIRATLTRTPTPTPTPTPATHASRADSPAEPASREGVCGASPSGAEAPTRKRSVPCTEAQAAAIYAAYPRQADPEAAKRAIRAAVKRLTAAGNPDPVGYLLERTRAFAASPAGQKSAQGERDYRKHAATWFNAGSYANEAVAEDDNLDLSTIALHAEPTDEDHLAVAQAIARDRARNKGGDAHG